MQSVHARLQTFFQPAALPSPSRLSSAETQLLQPAWKEMPLFQKSAADRDWLRCTHDLLQEGKTIPLTSHKKNSPQTRVSVWRSLAVQTISKSVPKSNSSRVSSTPVLLHPPLWSFLKGYFETTPMKQMLTSVAWYQQCSFYSLYHCGVQQIGDNKYGNIKKYLGALPCFCWHKLRFSSSFVFMWFHRLPRNHLSPKETMEMGLAVYLKYQPPLHRSRQGSDKARQSWL